MKFKDFLLRYKIVDNQKTEIEIEKHTDDMEISFLEMKDRYDLTTEEVEIALKPYRNRYQEKKTRGR